MQNNRITLQYSVEESELKFEVQRLVNNALDRLASITCEKPPASTIMSMITVDEINALRTELAKLDILLADASVIIQNYVDYKHQQRAAAAMDTNDDPFNVEAIKDRLQNFKENLETHENTD